MANSTMWLNNTPPRVYIRSIKFAPILGFGYWKDVYGANIGLSGHAHNIILPFVRIQIGYLESAK